MHHSLARCEDSGVFVAAVQESAAAGRGGVVGGGGTGGGTGRRVAVAAEEGGFAFWSFRRGVADGFFVAGGEEGHFDSVYFSRGKVYLEVIVLGIEFWSFGDEV
jgi:hypothetical protein